MSKSFYKRLLQSQRDTAKMRADAASGIQARLKTFARMDRILMPGKQPVYMAVTASGQTVKATAEEWTRFKGPKTTHRERLPAGR